MSRHSDIAETFNGLREQRAERRRVFGRSCPACLKREPKRNATILLPGQRCYCGYVDPRSRAPDGKAERPPGTA